MSGGYPNPNVEPLGILVDQLREIFRRLTILESPTGTSAGSLEARVDALSAATFAKSSTDDTRLAALEARVAALEGP